MFSRELQIVASTQIWKNNCVNTVLLTLVLPIYLQSFFQNSIGGKNITYFKSASTILLGSTAPLSKGFHFFPARRNLRELRRHKFVAVLRRGILTQLWIQVQRNRNCTWRKNANTNTPWKINMEHTNHPFRKENDLPNLHDYVPC